MNSQTAVELFISLGILLAGLLTLAFRDRQNPYIGVRIGYTYMSGEAWRKANTVGGLFFVGLSLVMITLAVIGVSITTFTLVLVTGVLIGAGLSITIARRVYEMEEISTEAPAKPEGERIEVKVGPYMLIQLAFLGLYLLLVALNWRTLPDTMAVHFDASGNPNGFMSKLWGALLVPILVWIIPFGLTVLGKDPGFFARMGNFSTSGWRAWAWFNTLMSLGIIMVSSSMVLYNLGKLPSKAMTYSTLLFMALVFIGIYLLLRVRGNGRA
ncbi:DUF1648 domain-containing protein [Thermococcus sp.]|uniref:DUF1648 domain-containing protein n=1 Tax=Thermococcus sp. TaxID=35749 RepID=UPI002606240E|nr:DUF1648 domain-containing protein [Thermococcus sp.]